MTKKQNKYQVRLLYGLDKPGEDWITLSEVYLEEHACYKTVIKHLNDFYNMYPEAEPQDGETSFVGCSHPLKDGSGMLDIIFSFEEVED